MLDRFDATESRNAAARILRLGMGPLFAASLFLMGCGDDDSGSATSSVIVFSGEGNRLNAYASAPGFAEQTVIQNRAADPNGRDINGQICFLPDGSRRFIAGEDTGQSNEATPQGWGFFQLEGSGIGNLSARQIGKLTPTYQDADSNAENYGCGFLADGRLVTSDVGDQASGPANGQLIVWFPPFDAAQPRYCKIDIAIGTAGGIYVDGEDRVYVASARGNSGVFRYHPPFPSGDDAAGGCARTDATGAPLADSLSREKFIDIDTNVITPNAIVSGHGGHFFVSSVLNGVIGEYDAEGRFVRRVLSPAPGDTIPIASGTPLGLGIDSAGTIYFADIGLVIGPRGVGPGEQTGTLRRIRFENDAPLAPETMDTQLSFPDGIGILEE